MKVQNSILIYLKNTCPARMSSMNTKLSNPENNTINNQIY